MTPQLTIQKREIERQYNNLLQDVKTKEYYTKVDLTNRTNCYVCPNGHTMKSRDIDAGVTPMFMKCETCGRMGSSVGYRDVRPDLQPTMEWYRPSLKQLLKMSNRDWNYGLVNHVLRGGLMIRKIVKL